MKNADERKGRMRDVKGRMKEAAGIGTGQTEEALARARRRMGEAVIDLGEKIKR
jgi:uncharacterized protein YjbJ (UPF0337 family)